ncbi:hypothetical protein C492_09585 [Natronococcus jeotgali DSM 18795]|uniref:Uncharacterized protein n=1 Tax=Natronococcus jeotgali DSM 18795 TaxID=1227498 RepID=L9XK23_9EURY|nr:hypothetical protein C492_09585 [Natronococcus jeotgali DSM 18795]
MKSTLLCLEYLAFLRLNEEYVFGRDTEEYFGSGWNRLLVVQDLQRETASLEEQAESEIKILQAAELEEQLAQVLKRRLRLNSCSE